MAKAALKTTENNNSVQAFVKTIDEKRQADCNAIIECMQEASGFAPKMWGPAIIGFGSCHYKYESGHEGDMPLVGFSPRKSAFALYMGNYEGREALLEHFGKYKTAKSCIYIRQVSDIDVKVLKKLLRESIRQVKAKYKAVKAE